MSIEDQYGNALVTLDGVWTGLFKLFLVIVPLALGGIFAWGCWVTMGLVELKYETRAIAKELSTLVKRP